MLRARDFIVTPYNLEITSSTDPLPIVTSDMVADARSEPRDDDGDNRPLIIVELNATGRQRLAELTRRSIGKKIVVSIDDVVARHPIVHDPITSGRIGFPVPTNGYDMAGDARELVAALRSGRMPAKLLAESEQLLRAGAVVLPAGRERD